MLGQKVRLQIMATQDNINIMEAVAQEYDGKLNYSAVFAVILQRYENYKRTIRLMEKDITRNEEKLRNIEFELRQKLKPKEEKNE